MEKKLGAVACTSHPKDNRKPNIGGSQSRLPWAKKIKKPRPNLQNNQSIKD
jgi:hypothetical protein